MRSACKSATTRGGQLRRLAHCTLQHRVLLRLLMADDQERVGEGDRLAVRWATRLRVWAPSVDGMHVVSALRQAAGLLMFVKGEHVPAPVRRRVVEAFRRQPPAALLAA